MGDLAVYLEVKEGLVIAGGPEAVSRWASDGVNDRLNELYALTSALALCPKASGATLDWLNARIAAAQAEQDALTEIVESLAAMKQADDDAQP